MNPCAHFALGSYLHAFVEPATLLNPSLFNILNTHTQPSFPRRSNLISNVTAAYHHSGAYRNYQLIQAPAQFCFQLLILTFVPLLDSTIYGASELLTILRLK